MLTIGALQHLGGLPLGSLCHASTMHSRLAAGLPKGPSPLSAAAPEGTSREQKTAGKDAKNQNPNFRSHTRSTTGSRSGSRSGTRSRRVLLNIHEGLGTCELRGQNRELLSVLIYLIRPGSPCPGGGR